jgi:hypothetical protein
MDDLEAVLVYLPPDLAAFTRACVGQVDVSEVVAAALELLRADLAALDIYMRSGSPESPRLGKRRACGGGSHSRCGGDLAGLNRNVCSLLG